jgi:hypothetical protein
MRTAFSLIRTRLDRMGIFLSGLCALHCLLGILLVGIFGLGAEALMSPAIHRFGLVLALAIGIVSLGFGVLRHGRIGPLVTGGVGLAMMGSALAVGHGAPEAILTIAGVSLVALAHIRNLRGSCAASPRS